MSARRVTGEVGILDAVYLSKLIPPDRVYLVIKSEGGSGYLGTLMFETASLAKAIFDILNTHLNKRISEIAAVDVPPVPVVPAP